MTLLLLLACVTVQERTRHVDGGTVVIPAEVDLDGDGHAAWADGGRDCDDADPAVHPGAPEVCNGIDDDCDQQVDDDDDDHIAASGTAYWTRDQDGDGYGVGPESWACTPPSGVALRGGDCDDTKGWVNPGAAESCRAGDDDCDGLADEADPDLPASQLRPFFPDRDDDGWGDPDGLPVDACAPPQGFAVQVGDCDDAMPEVSPDGRDACADGIDQDCDGQEPNRFAARVEQGYSPRTALTSLGSGFTVEAWVEPGDGDTAVFDWGELTVVLLEDRSVLVVNGHRSTSAPARGPLNAPLVHLAVTWNPFDENLSVFVDGTPVVVWFQHAVSLVGELAVGAGRIDADPLVVSQLRVRLGHVQVEASRIDALLEPTADTALLWRFDAGEGTHVEDLSGYGHHGTVAPDAWVVPACGG